MSYGQTNLLFISAENTAIRIVNSFQVSRADIHFMTFLDMVIYGHQNEQMLDNVPKCKALYERTRALPNIKKYHDSMKK